MCVAEKGVPDNPLKIRKDEITLWHNASTRDE